MDSNKMLVTTDFSKNSKAGLRFAIQLASQNGLELTFFHSYNLMIPTSWSSEETKTYKKEEVGKLQNELNLFVEKIYKEMDIVPVNKNCVLKSAVFTQNSIMKYAAENKFSFICISTRGAGKLERFFGTNTANLIIHSTVPVIAVPHNYKVQPVERILYASDLVNLEKELLKVVAFARPLASEVQLLHFTSPLELMLDPKVLDIAVQRFSDYDVKLNFRKRNYIESLISEIEAFIKKTSPSLMIMFTDQNRSLFQRIFLASKSAEYSFNAKVPLLVFNKA